MAGEQSMLGKIQDWFTKNNDVGVPRNAYTAAILNDPSKGVREINPTIPVVGPALANMYTDYSKAGGGAVGVGAALRGDYDRSVDWASKNVIEPPFHPAQMYRAGQNALSGAIGGLYSGVAKGPEQAARDFQAQQAANHSDRTVGDPGSPKAPLPQPPAGYVAGQAPYDPRYTAPTPQIQPQADYQSKLPPGMMDKPSDPAIVAAMLKQGANGPRTAQGAYTDALLQEARALPEPLTKVQRETARLSDLGFSKLMTPGVSSDGPLPNKTMVKADAPIKGSDLPKDLQAAYAQRGIEIDPNALYEKMSYGNVEGKGSAVGYRKFDPNRQQGTFSVTPGLSDAERQQVAQIDANQARQAAYGVSRKTGELYDAAQQHQQQQAALLALKQMQMQQEQNYRNQQLSLEQRKAAAAEANNAGKLMVDQGNMLTQGRRAEQQSAHDRASRQDNFMKDHFRKWATESPAGIQSKNQWDDFATSNLGVLSAGARTNEPPKFATPYASKTAGMIDMVYPDGKVRTVPYIDYVDALSQ